MPSEAPIAVVADDDPGVRALVVELLAAAGYRPLAAADGEAAWALVRAHRPAVVVADHHMPGRSGALLARAIKADPALSGTRVILVSGAGHPAALAAIRASGADRFLPKPFALAALARAVAEGPRGGALDVLPTERPAAGPIEARPVQARPPRPSGAGTSAAPGSGSRA
jgi:CheY-like chemotaxis protein